MFIHAAVEALPRELDGVANEGHIYFPWGSLLRAGATGDETILESLRRLCVAGALVEIITGLDPKRDQAEIEALALPKLTKEFLEMSLVPRYEASGFEGLEQEVLGHRNGLHPELRGPNDCKGRQASFDLPLMLLENSSNATILW